MASKIKLTTIASLYLPPSKAWVLDDGRVVVEHVGRTVFDDLAAAKLRFPSTEFIVTDEPHDEQ